MRACVELEKVVLSWPEVSVIRGSVIRTNETVLSFWKRMGAEDTGISTAAPSRRGSIGKHYLREEARPRLGRARLFPSPNQGQYQSKLVNDRRAAFGLESDGLQSSRGGTSMKKMLLLGVVACAVALSVIAQQSSAKESDEAEIRAMEAAMVKGFAAKDLDHGLAPYLQDETLFIFDAIPPRQYVGIKAWRANNEGFMSMFQGPVKMEMSDLQRHGRRQTGLRPQCPARQRHRQGRQANRPDPSSQRRLQEDQRKVDHRRGAPLVPGRCHFRKGGPDFQAVAVSSDCLPRP